MILVARRNIDDDPILDANDAVRWGVSGMWTFAVFLALVAVRDALNLNRWQSCVAGFAIIVAAGYVLKLLRRAFMRYRDAQTQRP